MPKYEQIRVIDTHTGGEPTRVVVSGGPDLGLGKMSDRLAVLRERFDEYRSAIVNEPRGSDVLVGALLCEPTDPDCIAGVIFFNNVGYLGMCGHGTIGVAVALGQLGRIDKGRHWLETPVGVIAFDYDGESTVTIDNVPSYRLAADVAVEVEGYGTILGDVAWGGNWFYLVTSDHGQNVRFENIPTLTDFCWSIRHALEREGITGANGALIDHIELFTPTATPNADSRNFVLCPGGAYDRSPCGTGTSAKLACLYVRHKLAPGEVWRQESIVGSIFEGSFQLDGDRVLPSIRGTAHVTVDGTLLLDPSDPFRMGIHA